MSKAHGPHPIGKAGTREVETEAVCIAAPLQVWGNGGGNMNPVKAADFRQWALLEYHPPSRSLIAADTFCQLPGFTPPVSPV
ncbi:unnamed protein product [Clonostachys rosea f. rosea IK726]|uniref:Uncharacterized protein n=1 Tax=Clonostachys rosea f. rosea IK726 TaxID=1349383 RepID=A0ACA9UQ09_BIOOC|nr:unnamed protein product [Clonostachys rosea f. rosea IK726]